MKVNERARAPRDRGFTLVELIVAMVILATLTAIAIPSYSIYVLKSHRTEAKSALLDLASLEERYFSDWYPLRLLRVGAAVFVDVGRTWGSAPLAEPNLGILRDLGFGLRFGNSRSGLGNIIHVDLAFPLDGDPSIKRVQFLVTTRQTF